VDDSAPTGASALGGAMFTKSDISWNHSGYLGTWAYLGNHKLISLVCGLYVVECIDDERMPVNVVGTAESIDDALAIINHAS